MTRAAQHPRASPATRVLALSCLLLLFAGTAYAVGLKDVAPAQEVDIPLGFLALVLLFAASEVMVVHLAARGEAYTVSLSEVPLVLGLTLASPGALLAARLIGGGLILAVYRRQPLRKLVFNLALFASESTVAIVVFHLVLGDSAVVTGRGFFAALVATEAASLFGMLCVTVAMSLFSGKPSIASMQEALRALMITTAVNTAVGFGVAAALIHDRWLAVPLAAGALLLYLLYRAYVTLQHRYQELEALHVFTEQVTSSLDLDVAIRTILSSARQLLRSDQAWLLVPGLGNTGPLLVRDLGTEVGERRLPGPQARELLQAISPDRVAHHIEVKALPGWFGTGYKDLVTAPVWFDRDAVGVLVAANRLPVVSTFDNNDLKLLETLANQAGVALQNGRLFGRLKAEAERRTHQALHDSLTGLPNRTQLDERFRQALDEARHSGSHVGALVIDLEGFKDVNDTLGHQTGDEVLKHVCRRMGDHLPDGAMLARFGGDEFVVLLTDVDGEAEAVEVASRLLESLSAPFRFHDLTLAVGARVGVSLSPEHGVDPSTLLQRADVAMYRAKQSPNGVAVYTPEDDPFTPQRLALAGELREAIGRREIEVLFQPLIDLHRDECVGAEALVRWRHPQRGLLPAGSFVPVAERTGMIHPLTIHVLAQALEQCNRWRAEGRILRVSVNLSVQNLLDPRLPGDLLDTLVESGLPPDALVLELTESIAMAEVRRTMAVLSQIHEMGVKIAIDDFGTGYSSLAYLRRLPVSELKIDRSFVHSLAIDDPGAAIVATVIELGHQLGLQVVAEGVESVEALERLTAMGCDLAQGYVISPPRTAASFAEWLSRRKVSERPVG